MRVDSDGVNTMRFEVDGFTFTFKRDDGPITDADLDHITAVVKAMRELRDTIRTHVDSGATGPDVDLPRTHPRRAPIRPKKP